MRRPRRLGFYPGGSGYVPAPGDYHRYPSGVVYEVLDAEPSKRVEGRWNILVLRVDPEELPAATTFVECYRIRRV